MLVQELSNWGLGIQKISDMTRLTLTVLTLREKNVSVRKTIVPKTLLMVELLSADSELLKHTV